MLNYNTKKRFPFTSTKRYEKLCKSNYNVVAYQRKVKK